MELMITHSAGTGGSPFELVVEGTGERIMATCHTVSFPGSRQFEICIQAEETDGVSLGVATGHYEVPGHYRLLDALLCSPGRVIDLGAHIGTFAAYAAAFGHKVIAVEASSRNVALLKENLKRNNLDRVHVVHAAASDKSGYVEFTEFGAYGVVANPALKWPTTRVPAITVDGLLADFGWPDVDFVKMDIEGSELMALRGMMQSLAKERGPNLVFESNGHTLHLFGHTPNTMLELLHGAGYQSWLISDGHFSPVGPTDLQLGCVVDYVALKGRLPDVQGWCVDPPLSNEDQIQLALAGSRHANAHVRAYVGRTVQHASAVMLSDPRIEDALSGLAQDPERFVRQAVAWFGTRTSGPG